MSEEILDLVNEQDEVIGGLSRAEIYRQQLSNFRVVHAFIVNSQGKIWIPQRTALKKIAPNGLDYSVAGHVESGKSCEKAFRRETQEETGIDTTVVPWKVKGKLTPTEGAHFFEMVYEIQRLCFFWTRALLPAHDGACRAHALDEHSAVGPRWRVFITFSDSGCTGPARAGHERGRGSVTRDFYSRASFWLERERRKAHDVDRRRGVFKSGSL